jgi:uncharacterized lipoprotein
MSTTHYNARRNGRPLTGLAGSAFLALALSACALSPQTVMISPDLTPPPGQISGTRTVALEIKDDRDSVVIGTRGGLYSDTSTLSTEDDIRPGLGEPLTKALEKQGYNVVGPGDHADMKLTVELRTLTYEADVGTVTGTKIKVGASIGVTVRKGGDTLTSGYETRHTETMATAPDAKENEEVINTVLAKSLDEMLTDRELRSFMSE